MKIRSFIAISLPADIRRELARIETELRKGAGAPVKWVETANLHLTLKFLGDIEFENIPAILDAMYKAAGTTGPLNMELNGLGVFPSPRRVRIVWVGLGGETEKLAALQQRLEISLEPLGFARESRDFQPHLTIGRVREQAGPAEREAIGDRVRSFTSPVPCRSSRMLYTS
jgi:2'-5' RNA ligase